MKKVIYVAILLVLIALHFRNTIVWGMDNNVYDCQMNSIYYCLKSAGFDMSKEYYISNPFYIQNNINNESISKLLLSGIFQDIASQPAECFGDRVSNFLKF